MSRIAQDLLICWVVSCYEVRLSIRVNIMPCGSVTKLEGSDCLFLWLCQMFLWVPRNWHEVFSPERDRMPCSCFCGQTHWELGLFTISRRTLTSLTMFIGFSPRGVSHAAFPLWFGIIYELTGGGKGLSLPPVLHQSMWRLLPGSSTAVLEYTYSKGKPVRMGREVLEDTHLRREESEQGCQGGKELLGRSAGQRLRYIREQMNWG